MRFALSADQYVVRQVSRSSWLPGRLWHLSVVQQRCRESGSWVRQTDSFIHDRISPDLLSVWPRHPGRRRFQITAMSKSTRPSLRDFKNAARAKLASSEIDSVKAADDIVVFATASASHQRNRPAVCSPENYVVIVDSEGGQHILPEPVLLASQVGNRTSRVLFHFSVLILIWICENSES
jgi:hypothetical protein